MGRILTKHSCRVFVRVRQLQLRPVESGGANARPCLYRDNTLTTRDFHDKSPVVLAPPHKCLADFFGVVVSLSSSPQQHITLRASAGYSNVEENFPASCCTEEWPINPQRYRKSSSGEDTTIKEMCMSRVHLGGGRKFAMIGHWQTTQHTSCNGIQNLRFFIPSFPTAPRYKAE